MKGVVHVQGPFLISYEYQVYIDIGTSLALFTPRNTSLDIKFSLYHLFLLFQHTFIQSAKSLTILNNMIQEALNIMEEESTREDNEV